MLIPYTSALQRLTGGTTVGSLMVSAADAQSIDSVQKEITALLEQRHGVVAGQPDDFSVRNLQDIAQAASATASILGLLLAAAPPSRCSSAGSGS